MAKEKKPKQKSITALQKELWNIVRNRIYERDFNMTFLENKIVKGVNRHAGHLFPMDECGARTSYHPKNIHIQTFHENINLGGNGAVYALKFIQVYGADEMNKLHNLFRKDQADRKNGNRNMNREYYYKMIELWSESSFEEIEAYIDTL